MRVDGIHERLSEQDDVPVIGEGRGGRVGRIDGKRHRGGGVPDHVDDRGARASGGDRSRSHPCITVAPEQQRGRAYGPRGEEAGVADLQLDGSGAVDR